MKRLFFAALVAGLMLSGIAHSDDNNVAATIEAATTTANISAAAKLDNPGGIGGLESLRGLAEIEATRPADLMKRYPRDQGVIDSDYVYQPPLIPHTIRHYEVSLNANKCLACHSWKNAKEMGATKISVTHYVSPQQGQVLSDVSPSRYFCLQCHVPQADAKPLVENDFKRVSALR
ncbi:nitrate reductase cytochrome c-type subunit [Photobacterium carnosum]|uniref:nitrate reductase cytochrome c-type subunit n=1 Tax=Photobacterium carnosum TaxID=2023717 RepID=UPI001E4398EC|nr:nitrate reductase cytochrome c-type subunit [Photobacterium carnosum]MCD9523661.1 periplasmic nitrate reductase electron transfer subunit [Photobacterium carnosum]MCD9528582.1 periplasmic nitrate reductase electron transfer subunit [Photobacterium carnosum]MCD9541937.1 periplasmic nitrate reductase electron transfer subunit [Photobacterium carnosum]MCD9543667.1 periplasmic nitrate reductase electron transfer subunit [Photobacterium carnosum]MCF2152829.1 periplasmic nitrate reductase electro